MVQERSVLQIMVWNWTINRMDDEEDTELDFTDLLRVSSN